MDMYSRSVNYEGVKRMTKKYALIGAAGYIAPRHMKAIKDTGGELVAALDPHDSVGVLDVYFPNCQFFTEFERFERFLDPWHTESCECPVDYLVVCSPNYLHDTHIRFGLRLGLDVICEKPLVINPHNLYPLINTERMSAGRIYPILQCRLHPKVRQLWGLCCGNKFAYAPAQIAITYNTLRGPWYLQSWKGEDKQSGGLIVNIGIHLLDLMCWMFGEGQSITILDSSPLHVAGTLHFQEADVYYELNLRSKCDYRKQIDINQGEFVIDLTEGFQDLHTQAYRDILVGEGFSAESVAPAIELASQIRKELK